MCLLFHVFSALNCYTVSCELKHDRFSIFNFILHDFLSNLKSDATPKLIMKQGNI